MKSLYKLSIFYICILKIYECTSQPNNQTSHSPSQVQPTTLVVPYRPPASSLPFSSIMNFTYHPPSNTVTQAPPSSSTTLAPANTTSASSEKTATKIMTTTVMHEVTRIQKVTQTVTVSKEDEIDKRMKSCYRKNRKVSFTQYWIPKENEWDETNEGKRVFLGGDTKKTKILDNNKKEIATVSQVMFDKCKMEGTCLLDTGDLINIDNGTKSFIKVGGKGRDKNVFGLGSGAQNLVPFVSVAANDIPNGQKLYISQLDGLDLGGGIRHNGCVRVDDDSWSFDSCQVDWFVLSYVDYLWLDIDDEVSVKYADDCQLKNYVTKHHLASVKATDNEKVIPSLLNAKYHKL